MSADEQLLPREIHKLLKTGSFARRIYYLPEVDSTNRIAKQFAKNGEQHGTLVIAGFQTAGRGRRARRWVSPPHRNLLFSLILRPAVSSSAALTLTLAFSLTIAETLSELLGVDLKVKWPNDVVSSAGKICGLLSESSSSAGRASFVVVGIGINVNVRGTEMPRGLGAVSCYSLTGVEHDRKVVLLTLIPRLEEAYGLFLARGFKPFVKRYVARLSLLDKRLKYGGCGRQVTGEAVDVRDDGALVIRSGDELLSIYDEEGPLT